MRLDLKKKLTISLAVLFAMLSAFHIIGAFGVWRTLPIIPEIPGVSMDRPSSISWLGVATALALAVVVILARGDFILRSFPTWVSTTACLAIGSVFIIRTIGDFWVMGIFKTVVGTDFAYWDARIYTPLCLVIGLSALLLASTPRNR